MATQQTLSRLQTWIWVLVYGGLLTFVLGLATRRYDEGLGLGLAIGGGAVALVGFVLIFVRARLRPDATS